MDCNNRVVQVCLTMVHELHTFCQYKKDKIITTLSLPVNVQVEKTLEMTKNRVGMALKKLTKQGRNVYDVFAK